MLLEGKTVVVSGVGVGLGRELAAAALRDGANVVLGARTERVLEETAAKLDPSGERVAWVRADITRPADCEALVAGAAERFGRVDGLVQVAAYELVFGGLQDTDLDDWRRAFETNVIGSVSLLRAVAPVMKAAGGGTVVWVGSQSMWLPQLPQAGYAASKAALHSAMLYFARELGPDRIRLNMVVPSWMWGPAVEGYLTMRAKQEGRTLEALRAEVAQGIPLGDIVADEEVAEATLLLLSDRARAVTGQALLVNGGELMR